MRARGRIRWAMTGAAWALAAAACQASAGFAAAGDAGADSESSAGTESDDGCGDGACVRYVDAAAAGPHDGCSWATAFTTVQEGIDAAAGCAPGQVCVAAGTYYVLQPAALALTADLAEGVELLGGFAGTETAVAQRDWLAHETILDGHENGGSAGRATHVVTIGEDAAIDGFTITGGRAMAGALDPNTGSGAGVGRELVS